MGGGPVSLTIHRELLRRWPLFPSPSRACAWCIQILVGAFLGRNRQRLRYHTTHNAKI
jgi:hypothetical protein